ncbi:MAG: hypothetical protein ACJASQ_002684 [Crocinitomicaceae bacterium]|jgi:hypothetical protein
MELAVSIAIERNREGVGARIQLILAVLFMNIE